MDDRPLNLATLLKQVGEPLKPLDVLANVEDRRNWPKPRYIGNRI
jgi:hypothetical protein